MPAPSTIAPASNAPGLEPTSAPQHLRALASANRVRLARAALKRAVASDQTTAAEVILDSPWEAESMAISELLSSQRRWGRTRSRKFLSRLGLSENKKIGTFTPRQRQLLADGLNGKPQDDATGAAAGQPLFGVVAAA
jgi:hypothetical protein